MMQFVDYNDIKESIKDCGYPSPKSLAKSKSKFSNIKKNIQIATSFLDDIDPSITLRLMCVFNNIYDFPKCSQCGNKVKVIDKIKNSNGLYNNVKFRQYCSRKCTVASGQFLRNVKNTNKERYGVENVMQCETVKDTVKATNRERYGTEWHTQSNNFKIKSKETWSLNYGDGIINPSQADSVKQKKILSSQLKYGVDNIAQADEVKNKTKITNLKRYNCVNPFSSDIIKEKIKSTNLIKYGVENVMQNHLVLEKTKQTNFQRRGCWPSQCPIVRKKINKTNMYRYGVPWVTMSHDIKEKIRNTFYNEYGCYFVQTDEFKKKSKETSLKNWNTEHPMQNSEYYDNFVKTSLNKTKDYTLPSGRIVQLQGYEPKAVDILLKFYEEDDIVFGSDIKPWVWYELDGKKKRYFPDLYIKPDNLIVEVKSEYTMTQNININKLKEKASIETGFNFIFMII